MVWAVMVYTASFSECGGRKFRKERQDLLDFESGGGTADGTDGTDRDPSSREKRFPPLREVRIHDCTVGSSSFSFSGIERKDDGILADACKTAVKTELNQ